MTGFTQTPQIPQIPQIDYIIISLYILQHSCHCVYMLYVIVHCISESINVSGQLSVVAGQLHCGLTKFRWL